MYLDRFDAGKKLAAILAREEVINPLILALPRGGIAVAKPIAETMRIPIHILITRKIGHPLNAEVAIGAVMPDGSAIIDERVVAAFNIKEDYIQKTSAEEYKELQRRMKCYPNANIESQITGRHILLVDDGIATGYTIKAAIKWLQGREPAKIVLAVPVAPPDVVAQLQQEVSTVICPLQPEDFRAVGMYYRDFSQTTDEEVLEMLSEAMVKVRED